MNALHEPFPSLAIKINELPLFWGGKGKGNPQLKKNERENFLKGFPGFPRFVPGGLYGHVGTSIRDYKCGAKKMTLLGGSV